MPYTQRSKAHQLDSIPRRSLVLHAISSVSLVFVLAGPQTAHAQSGLARIDPNLPSANGTDQGAQIGDGQRVRRSSCAWHQFGSLSKPNRRSGALRLAALIDILATVVAWWLWYRSSRS